MYQKFNKWVNINHEFIWDFISLKTIFKNIISNVYQKELKIKGNEENIKKIRKIRK